MKSVLVIDDNTMVRENVAEILALSEYIVHTADNGKIGFKLALKERPDLIVCDILMPIMDGFEVFNLLRKHRVTNDIPVIFLSAKSEKVDFKMAKEMGADGYITKPFHPSELLAIIQKILNSVYTL